MKFSISFLLSCLIVALGHPTFLPCLGPLAGAIGYALFWKGIKNHSRLKIFFYSLCWYGIVALIQISWMTATEYHGFYILFIWLAISLWLAIQFSLFSVFVLSKLPLTLSRILALASIWTVIEWSRYYILCGYSWNLAGMALSIPSSIHSASIFGVLGLSFWVIFINLVFFKIIEVGGAKTVFYWCIGAFVPYIFSFFHTSYHEKKMTEKMAPRFSCFLVQTGISAQQKSFNKNHSSAYISPYDQWKRILSFLKKQQGNSVDLIVLPEAAVPYACELPYYDKKIVKNIFYEVFGENIQDTIFISDNKSKVSNLFWVQSIANLFQSEVVIGLDHVDASGKNFSSAFHIKPFTTDKSRYDKQILVPLGEYLPFQFLSKLVKKYGIEGFFTRGKESKLFTGKVPFSPSICYEETFPHKVREGRVLGAELLVNLTNDGWYPNTILPRQHFEHAKLRAIENGAPTIRACNTGVSAAVDSLGRTIAKLEENNADNKPLMGVLFAELSTYNYFTLYSLWGNWGIIAFCSVFIASYMFIRLFDLYRKTDSRKLENVNH